MAEDKKDEVMVMVGDGVEEGDQILPEEKKVKPKSDESDEDDDEADDSGVDAKGEKEDARTGHAEGEEEGEDAEAATKRQERKKRKQRQREARERNETEMRYLRRRNEDLEREVGKIGARVRTTEAATIEARIATLKNQIETAKEVEAKAIDAGAGADSVEAREIREDLEKGLARLESAKDRVEKEKPTERAGDREPPPEARLALKWIDKHKNWYDPKAGDEDSAIAQAVENTLLKTGHDPRTPEYWEELDKRLAKRLPHHFKKGARVDKDEDDDEDDEEDEVEDARPGKGGKPNGSGIKQLATPPQQRKPGGPRVSVGGRERPLKSNEVYISPDRKAAMIESGAWDDPVLRAKQLKAYRRWDEENRT